MLSSSVAGGSVCLRCQVRAVARRAIPSVAAAQIRGRSRHYASETTGSDSPENDLEAILRSQRHDDSRRYQPRSSWAQDERQGSPTNSKQQPVEKRTCPHCRKVFDTKQLMYRHKARGPCRARSATDESSSLDVDQETSRARPEINAVDAGHTDSVETPSTAALDAGEHEPDTSFKSEVEKELESNPAFRKLYKKEVAAAKKKYRRGNMTLEADASRLAVETLGKPAEVIVLRDRGQWKRKTIPILESPEESVQSSLEIAEFLQQEEGLKPDSVIQYIHGLRPEQMVLPARKFKSLFDTLADGFTSLQLESYVEWHRSGQHLNKIEDEFMDEDVINEDEAIDEDSISDEVHASSEEAAIDVQPAETEDQIPDILFDKPEAYPWIVEQTRWSPEVAGAVEDTDYPLRGYVLKSMRPKQRLIVQLMRECWGVSVRELLDGNGRIDVRVRDLEFKLLTLSSQRWLQKISRLFLGPGTQLEVIRSQNLIRFVAPKAVAETCVNALNETLQRLKTKSFKLQEVPMQNLDAGILAELGSITNSVVERDSPHEEIQVHWIDIRDESPEANKLEDLGDVIFRLLLTAHTSASTTSTLTIYPEVEGKGRFLDDFSDKNKLSWIDRRREWARLCLPLASGDPRTATAWPLTTEALKYKVQPTAEDLTLPTSTLKPKIDASYNDFTFDRPLEGTPLAIPHPPKEQPAAEQEPREVEGLELSKPTLSGWLPFKVSTNAVFGHILHQQSPSLIQALSKPTSALAKWPRTLSPLIPPIANMSLPGWVPYKQPIDATSTILMRFVPYAENGGASGDAQAPGAPHLELRLSASDRAVIAAHSLRAIRQTSISDVLLPAEHVDVRTTQRVYAELPGAALDGADGMAPLVSFLQDSHLEPSRGKLVTPPRLHGLGLPRWLARASSASAASASAAAGAKEDLLVADNTPSENELVPTSYVFAGLEVHRSLETTYDGWRLVYTSVEAGQGGGRRAELSLEAVPAYDTSLRRGRNEINSTFFLRSMYQLARGLKGHVVTGRDGEEVRTSISWVDQDWNGT